jgi:8-oxo-dGTP diphosphatase
VREVVGVAVTAPREIGTGARPRVLAARRSSPPHLAGLWELPGGKVEESESPARAAEREVAEELGCTVEVLGRLEGRVVVGEDLALVAVTARLLTGDPVPHEHGAVRWLRADQLHEVDWVPADQAFLPALRRLLGGD